METKLTKEEFTGVLDNWVKALRSGNYVQGQQLLFYENNYGKQLYCCLGVYCALAIPDIESNTNIQAQTCKIYNTLGYLLEDNTPEVIVAKVLEDLKFNKYLASMNDALKFDTKIYEKFINLFAKYDIFVDLDFENKIIDNSFNSIAEIIDQLKESIYNFYINEPKNQRT